MTPNFTLQVDKNVSVAAYVPENVFAPTFTSVLCIKAAQLIVGRDSIVLDLGCGCGVVGIALAKLLFVKTPVFASDVSSAAIDVARMNFELHGIAADLRTGSVFEPWVGMRFDYVVDDVSGITEDVAAVSPWFANNIPCATGPDGAELTLRVIEEAPNHLSRKGGLFIPVISLSNRERILAAARARFVNVRKVAAQTWALPEAMRPHLALLDSIRNEGRISFEERFGTILCSTDIYYCSN